MVESLINHLQIEFQEPNQALRHVFDGIHKWQLLFFLCLVGCWENIEKTKRMAAGAGVSFLSFPSIFLATEWSVKEKPYRKTITKRHVPEWHPLFEVINSKPQDYTTYLFIGYLFESKTWISFVSKYK